MALHHFVFAALVTTNGSYMDGSALVIPILHGTGRSLTETILHAEDPQVLYVKMTETDELSVTSIMRQSRGNSDAMTMLNLSIDFLSKS